ncbi:DapH/DapD/GlmU-related protein [Pseudoruegeria sp. HB172150]|uniref:acyltransferase n=1 Tax=Pseudoruegeria sp. HB172150 TaxID=2721164 RepID=UPI00352C1246
MKNRKDTRIFARAIRGIWSIFDPRALAHGFRILHYYNYTHVSQKRRMEIGDKVRIAPNASFANGDRIRIGNRVQIGARCTLWAGDNSGRIIVGDDVTFGPDCFLTASNYGLAAGQLVTEQPTVESDVSIGEGAWLGARVIVTAGVTVGAHAVIGAGSVVTKDIPEGVIAAGNPARTIRPRA